MMVEKERWPPVSGSGRVGNDTKSFGVGSSSTDRGSDMVCDQGKELGSRGVRLDSKKKVGR